MAKEIICVYQDCVLCGDRGKKLKKLIFEKNLNVRKVSFASDEGRELIYKGLMEQGIGSMPFFTDGEKFSYHLDDFVENVVKNTPKKIKKSKKVKKNENN